MAKLDPNGPGGPVKTNKLGEAKKPRPGGGSKPPLKKLKSNKSKKEAIVADESLEDKLVNALAALAPEIKKEKDKVKKKAKNKETALGVLGDLAKILAGEELEVKTKSKTKSKSKDDPSIKLLVRKVERLKDEEGMSNTEAFGELIDDGVDEKLAEQAVDAVYEKKGK